MNNIENYLAAICPAREYFFAPFFPPVAQYSIAKKIGTCRRFFNEAKPTLSKGADMFYSTLNLSGAFTAQFDNDPRSAIIELSSTTFLLERVNSLGLKRTRFGGNYVAEVACLDRESTTVGASAKMPRLIERLDSLRAVLHGHGLSFPHNTSVTFGFARAGVVPLVSSIKRTLGPLTLDKREGIVIVGWSTAKTLTTKLSASKAWGKVLLHELERHTDPSFELLDDVMQGVKRSGAKVVVLACLDRFTHKGSRKVTTITKGDKKHMDGYVRSATLNEYDELVQWLRQAVMALKVADYFPFILPPPPEIL
jgi:hypothetical protein